VKVPDVTVDAQAHVLRAQVYKFGLFAMMGAPSTEVGSAYAYPVPFVASRDRKIYFTNLPDFGTLRIYSATGEMLKEIMLNPANPTPLGWDVTNASGQALGADVYIYEISSGGNKKTGKIVVVR
jgi:hypothetical protein